MEILKVNTADLKPHEGNPRTITTRKFEFLKESIREFPDMLSLRPIIVDMQNRILCGNMRYRACVDLGITELLVKRVDIPEERARELMVKDNLSYGDWDWDVLDFNWDMTKVEKWLGKEQIDYSAIDEYEEIAAGVQEFYDGVKKAIQIDVSLNYDEAKDLERQCREIGIYIGGAFISFAEKLLNDGND